MNYQTPRGTYDILPEEMNAWHDVEDVIKEVTRVYRYQEIRTPYFESTNVFKRENDSSDMVNKEMYTFQMGSDSYTLRPEGTAGVIRAFDQHMDLWNFLLDSIIVEQCSDMSVHRREDSVNSHSLV